MLPSRPSNEFAQTLIVGAGLTGLILANRLGQTNATLLIVEKSKGVGGRMATRRTDSARFDHGAQFYTHQEPIDELHSRWSQSSLSTHWFTQDTKSFFKCEKGMTALAKDLAQGFRIAFEKRVVSLEARNPGWKVLLDSGEVIEAERVILTAPLPQCLEILRQSQLSFDPALLKIQYAKAVVALIEVVAMQTSIAGLDGYLEPKSSLIFSISDQKRKGLSPIPSLTVTLSADASEDLYERTDDEIVDAISSELRRLDPDFLAKTIQIKKWRYSHPLSRFESLFSSPAPHLYLAGDAFGGPSLNGASRSANALADLLATTPTTLGAKEANG